MDLASVNDLVAGLAGPQQLQLFSKSTFSATSNSYVDYWGVAGTPAAGATPTTAVACTNATTGALPFVNAASGNNNYLCSGAVNVSSTPHTVFLYDRLAHMAGLNGTISATPQTVGIDLSSGFTGRVSADYSDAEWFVEIYSALGITGRILTITYTDAGGTGSLTTTVTLPSSAIARRIFPVTPSSPMRSVESCQLSGTTGSAGNFGITAMRRIAAVSPQTAYVDFPSTPDPLQFCLKKIPQDACLTLTALTTSSTAPAIAGQFTCFER
jgi:hypothetical protein